MCDYIQQQISARVILDRVAKAFLSSALIALHKHAELFEGGILFETVGQVSLLGFSGGTLPFVRLNEVY